MAQLCAVCETAEAKYKCPTCRAPYCSLVCCKKHKETPCEPAPAPEKPQEPPAPVTAMDVDKEDVGPAEKLTDEQMGVLRTSADVMEMLANPAIAQALTQIDSSQDKMKTLEKALLDPTFAKFMYQALDEVVPAK
ncbi:ATP-dependent Clp protease proteolytic subunit 2, mitochondrial [Phytophthora pseudosyringae]|uniref:ATP-dependent Clp protease proteolytic subunit 2, mitochondrial n=1 Tax=Phytophthora pseudosyringae TaxID=221518 RepID=A0A8T1WH69_9STRA|nr:ATP-dependent Clp protease proteolytic subunit 2, mitochondrial [Phytophthora pseudosyringae]